MMAPCGSSGWACETTWQGRVCQADLGLLAALLLTTAPALAADLLRQVVGIQDGDTLTLLTPERRQVRVRLHGIGAPESRQPYGTRAQQELSALAFRQQVRVTVEDTIIMAARSAGPGSEPSTSMPSWCAAAPPGSTGSTTGVLRCRRWRRQPARPGAASGPCPPVNRRRPGSGGGMVAGPPRPRSHKPWEGQGRQRRPAVPLTSTAAASTPAAR